MKMCATTPSLRFLNFLLYVWVFCLLVCLHHRVPGAHRGQKRALNLCNPSYYGCEPPCCCWELWTMVFSKSDSSLSSYFVCLCMCFEAGSLCSIGWPGTCHVDHAGLRFRDVPDYASEFVSWDFCCFFKYLFVYVCVPVCVCACQVCAGGCRWVQVPGVVKYRIRWTSELPDVLWMSNNCS